MKKEEIQVIVKSIVPFIKKTIKEEVKRVVRPMIKESVENYVNKMLAEQFLSSVNGGRNTIKEMMVVDEDPQPRRQRRADPSAAKKKLIENLGFSENDEMFAVLEDVDVFDDNGEILQEGYEEPLDGEGEGVSLASLGLSEKRPFVKF